MRHIEHSKDQHMPETIALVPSLSLTRFARTLAALAKRPDHSAVTAGAITTNDESSSFQQCRFFRTIQAGTLRAAAPSQDGVIRLASVSYGTGPSGGLRCPTQLRFHPCRIDPRGIQHVRIHAVMILYQKRLPACCALEPMTASFVQPL